MQKNIQTRCNFMGKCTVCVKSLTFLGKRLSFSILFFGIKTLDYKAVSSAIFTAVSALSCAKGFIKFKQVVFVHTLPNQRVSKSVFSVSSYILVLRLVLR